MAAARLIAALQAAMLRLTEHPEIGALREDLADEPLRFWPASIYLIVDRPQTSPLRVVRVVHASCDVRALLAGEE